MFRTDDTRKSKALAQVKTIVLEQVPSASGFKNYQLDVYTKILASSKRSSRRTLRWIQQVEIAKLSRLERLSGHWDDLERSRAEAAMKVATGQQKQERA